MTGCEQVRRHEATLLRPLTALPPLWVAGAASVTASGKRNRCRAGFMGGCVPACTSELFCYPVKIDRLIFSVVATGRQLDDRPQSRVCGRLVSPPIAVFGPGNPRDDADDLLCIVGDHCAFRAFVSRRQLGTYPDVALTTDRPFVLGNADWGERVGLSFA
jgi:hypothetical protein